MAIDVVTPDGVAVSIKDAVGDVMLKGGPEFVGRLVALFVLKRVILASDLRMLLPLTYEVRE